MVVLKYIYRRISRNALTLILLTGLYFFYELKVSYNSYEGADALFILIWFQTADIYVVKAVNTMAVLLFYPGYDRLQLKNLSHSPLNLIE